MQAPDKPPCRLDRDPVCGRELATGQAPLSIELKGRTYLFCSERCRMLFSIRPAWFVDRTAETTRLKAS
jgi:YHS domain-containing protein